MFDESRWRPWHTIVFVSAAIWLTIILVIPAAGGDNDCGSLLTPNGNSVCGRPGAVSEAIAVALVLIMLVVGARCSPYAGRRRVASIALDAVVVGALWWAFRSVAFSDRSLVVVLLGVVAGVAAVGRVALALDRLRNDG